MRSRASTVLRRESRTYLHQESLKLSVRDWWRMYLSSVICIFDVIFYSDLLVLISSYFAIVSRLRFNVTTLRHSSSSSVICLRDVTWYWSSSSDSLLDHRISCIGEWFSVIIIRNCAFRFVTTRCTLDVWSWLLTGGRILLRDFSALLNISTLVIRSHIF